ncbi:MULTISPECIES: hypothetical protein [Ochrobactrum]|uniref:Uncharacterized protein n=1 Tax=Ochrobactrum quorumnocens TaxID=271865 RepID=A0A5N1K286_9HYPH|nr:MULTISPECIES: hypothetical protein [Brucella/Ochrobactrum group]KAA9368384.1 hypothetical protein F3W84_10895 [[Ochrobactrum] quorumnocens]MBD7991707.1 hypothetical protein [Ochrobactrum gallinarum]MDH7792602.1 uncharacterized protein YabE (DUF348 family) [Ochrobactrum sp. AN78]
MSISIQTGSAHLICNGVNEGGVEYSVSLASDGLEHSMRGRVWGSKVTIAKALDASEISLLLTDQTVIELQVEELDRDGSALVTARI